MGGVGQWMAQSPGDEPLPGCVTLSTVLCLSWSHLEVALHNIVTWLPRPVGKPGGLPGGGNIKL